MSDAGQFSERDLVCSLSLHRDSREGREAAEGLEHAFLLASIYVRRFCSLESLQSRL